MTRRAFFSRPPPHEREQGLSSQSRLRSSEGSLQISGDAPRVYSRSGGTKSFYFSFVSKELLLIESVCVCVSLCGIVDIGVVPVEDKRCWIPWSSSYGQL